MGCLIINNFLSDEEMGNLFTGSSIIEVDKESHEHLLDDDRISVILEIGNLQNSDGIELLGKTSEIGDSIKHGIEDYYKK
ncbi:MAG TPA: hypothetical protein VI894_02500 [Candidatus Nanoarchaeia archaeon]|nr:hypothetical protein [Candidatus Nanoarchaeia archaeon]